MRGHGLDALAAAVTTAIRLFLKAIDPRVWLVLIVIALIGAAYLFGRHDGEAIESSAWKTRELAINAESAAKMSAAQQRVIDTERRRAAELEMVSSAYQAQIKENDNAKDRVIAGLRDGTRQLYVNAVCPPGSGNAAGTAPASPGGRDAESRVQLSGRDAEFLTSFAARCDAVKKQLGAAQDVIIKDRKP